MAPRWARKGTIARSRQRLDKDDQVEQQCIKCLEWWPADEEFYYPNFATCKACYLEAKYARRRQQRIRA